jgi:hypothetical protein
MSDIAFIIKSLPKLCHINDLKVVFSTSLKQWAKLFRIGSTDKSTMKPKPFDVLSFLLSRFNMKTFALNF